MASLTSAARRFAAINRSSAIVSGQWLDRDGHPVTGHPNTWVKLRYRFDNGQQVTLGQADRDSLRDAEIEPRWLNEAPEGDRP